MPTVAVDKADLWERLGKEYSVFLPVHSVISDADSCRYKATDEFDRLCFDYGLELDEDVCLPTSQRM